MSIQIIFKGPQLFSRKAKPPEGETAPTETVEPIFTVPNIVLIGFGIAAGVIIKQHADIHTLKRTIGYLTEGIR